MIKSNVAEDGILVVIDEFDQIDDPKGFASFLKSLATNAPKLKFCIVGVANDIKNLVKEHKSSDRLFAGSIINLPGMNEEEQNEIIDNAESAVDDVYKFTDGARKEIVNLSNKHPYIVHLLGKHALRNAYFNNNFEIDDETIQETLKDIADKEIDPVLEGRYKTAVASSNQREVVLRSFAVMSKKNEEVLTTNAYKIALDGGVENPSQYVGHLVTDEYGAEIEKIRERYYRFKDSLFETYVLARPPIFD